MAIKKTIKKVTGTLAAAGLLAFAWTGVASAHVVVRPAEVETAAFQSFTVGVPTEGDSPTVKVRLQIPSGVGHVTPNVKPGWQIETTKTGEGEEAIVTEITWSGGEVPVGQRDDFVFSAQVPADATTLQWKAYQTYADGNEVAWDQPPSSDGHGDSDVKPYSQTSVVENLTNEPASDSDDSADSGAGMLVTNVALVLAVVAIILSVAGLSRETKNKKAKK